MKRPGLHLRRREGSVLVTALLTSTVIGIALCGYLTLVGNQHKANMRDQAWQTALPVAEAGVEEALSHLQKNGPWSTGLVSQGWVLRTNLYRKQGKLTEESFYNVLISNDRHPSILSEGFVRLPLVNKHISRSVVVHTRYHYLIAKGLLVKRSVNSNGNAVLADAYDSSDPLYSTFGQYDPAKAQDGGGIATLSSAPNQLNFGSARIYGQVATGPGGKVNAANWVVGSHLWQATHRKGIQPGWFSDDMTLTLPDVLPPFATGYMTPTGGVVGVSAYSLILSNGNYQMDNGILQGRVLVTGNATLYVTSKASINFDPINDFISILPGAKLQLYVACHTANLPNVVNDQTPVNFAYFGLPGNRNLNQKVNANFIGTIYAPSARYTLGGNGSGAAQNVCGAVIVESVTYNDKFYFHYDNNLTRVADEGSYVVTSWSER